MTEELNVYKPEVYVNFGCVKLPNLYIQTDNNIPENDKELVIKYLKKIYGGEDILKRIIHKAIDKGEIKVDIRINDTDRYDTKDVLQYEGDPLIITYDILKN